MRGIVRLVGSWGAASFENDAARDWFLLVEEASDPGAVMASAIEDVLSAAEHLDADLCSEAIAAAELCACCAGQLPDLSPCRMGPLDTESLATRFLGPDPAPRGVRSGHE